MIWGDRCPDRACDVLIDSVRTHSANCVGAVILTDRTDRANDPFARRVPIARDFNLDVCKQRGLPVKILMSDISVLPKGATCLYVDLDNVILGSLDQVAGYARHAHLLTMAGSKPFSARWRLISRLTKGRLYAFGNAPFFAYRNAFPGNPTEQFRKLRDSGALADWNRRDERFVAKCCQDVIRGISSLDVANFKREFLARTLWLARVRSIVRYRLRQDIKVITFTGAQSKREVLLAMEDGAVVTDKRGRVGRWNAIHTSALKDKIVKALIA